MGIAARFRVDARFGVLVVALGAGGVAAALAHQHLSDAQARLEAAHRVQTKPAVVAAHALASGAVLSEGSAAVRAVPLEWLPGDAIGPHEFEAVAGATLARAFAAGEVVRWSDLQVAAKPAFSSQLAPGRRAVTIPIDEINSLSGMLEPGDVVDLYVSFEHGGQRITRLLLGAVAILATGRQRVDARSDEAGSFATITLEAAPNDALRLIAARQQGSIAAMLRRPGDTAGVTPAEGGDLASMLGLPAVAPPPRRIPVIFGDRAPVAMPDLSGRGPSVDDAHAWLADLGAAMPTGPSGEAR